MFTIRKEFSFSAGHALDGLPSDHPCTRIHGHNYVVTVELASNFLNDPGFVVDYRKLDPIKEYIDDNLDHRHLNDVLEFNPTAELIARHLFIVFKDQFPELRAIEVRETPKTSARYEPNLHN